MTEHATNPAKAGTQDRYALDELRPTLTLITRVAKDLFDVAASDVTLSLAGGLWRASDPDGKLDTSDPASEQARLMDKVLWVEDLREDPRFHSHPMVTGAPHLRFYAGAAIILADGAKVGALGVFDPKPRPLNVRRSKRLRDLAQMVAHEFDRVMAARRHLETLERAVQSEQRLNIAVENAQLHVFEIDFVNETLVKMGAEDTIYEKPMSYGEWRQAGGLIHEDDRPAMAASMAISQATGEPCRLEYRIKRQDGRHVWVASSVQLIKDDKGETTRIIGALRNITASKQAEAAMAEAMAQAEAANVAKSTFLATMSHEIRTPLNGVLGMAQAMAADGLDPVQRERLDVVRQSGEALLAILNDILDLSKIEAGKLDLEAIEFDLGELALGAHAAFTALANKKGLSFALSFDNAAGVYLGDPTRVRQILYNLISNALKFTEHGEIRVTVSRVSDGLALSVADTGIGMTPEVVSNLFTKFAQADASTTRKYGGTGLGLAICRQLAEMMGGSIRAESQLGAGTTFTVTVPLPWVRAAQAPALPSDLVAADDAGEDEGLNLRVLAAEDNAINQLVLKTMLHQVGVDPAVVGDGVAAVAAWEAGDYDLILMDVQMPLMDGMTATRAIRKAEAARGCAPIPIIALTANAMSHQIAEYHAAGMDGHVAKPIEARKLFAVLEMAAQRSMDQQTPPAIRAAS